MLHSPIIVVQDPTYGHVSTTNDILTQLELMQYERNLKDIDLNQFMNMTEEADFKQVGIRKRKDCRRLSSAAQSIKSSIDPVDFDVPRTTTTFQSLLAPFERRLSLPSFVLGHHKKQEEQLPDYETPRRHSEGTLLSPPPPPEYSCTVRKMGKANAKFELIAPNKKPLRRPWREMYLDLQGTMIKLYEQRTPRHYYYNTLYVDSTDKYYFMMNLSLANATLEIPTDYTKRPNVFRLVIKDGPQILFQVQSAAAAILWMEKIDSGIQIADFA